MKLGPWTLFDEIYVALCVLIATLLLALCANV